MKKFNFFRQLLWFALFFPLLSHAKAKNDCHQKHGAFDIGSGTTKAYAAIVDVCRKNIVKVIFEEQQPIPFNEALEKSPTAELPKALIAEASEKIYTLTEKMRSLEVQKISAIATSALRKAKNGSDTASAISAKAAIPVLIISQEEEAEIGYLSALAQRRVNSFDASKIIVWDIGGGSMQMLRKRGEKTDLFKGNLASVSFKNRVIKEVQQKDPNQISSPNPLRDHADQAVDLAQKHARNEVPPVFRSSAQAVRWIGIGGVLSISVSSQVSTANDFFTITEVKKALDKKATLSDEEIPGDYKATDVTNLALVLGYMRALGIQRVETARVNLTQGWIVKQLSK